MTNTNLKIKVNQNELIWDEENGLITFDGAPSLLFWDSAIELFFNTIEEVSGSDVSKTVYEVTGYRMGQLVSSYYQGRTDIEQILFEYRDIYKTAGWGDFILTYFSFEKKKVVVRLKNNWECRVIKATNKENRNVLLPSHWAGVFSGLLEQNLWYIVTNKETIVTDDFVEIEIFPSNRTPQKNIHDLARQKEQQSIMELEEKVKERTEELSLLVKELSSPIIPVLDGILVVPLIGKYSEDRLYSLIENALFEITRQKAKILLIDVTAIKHVNDLSINDIRRLIECVRLLGAECFIVGISPKIAIEVINSRVDAFKVRTFSTLQQGVEFAIGLNGYQLVKKP